ncbi:hypothetical protein [Aureliella helgolandensis]|uniref:Uncharacterized protein n=1 Tax=Aureliella helgolandensis TaxID=2527968 RepID=A0A518G1I2_9BACT|nr:hypothetical protein [Aureliella helgolandensis]QDV22455.1 hypothetical protein Q31a_07400 [Aureliella helgolandensis]
MAKFYVQSGNIRTVISADDGEKAALWIVHRAMQQVVPVYDDHELSPEQKSETAVIKGLIVLGNSILVNEVGFDHEDSQEMDTFELVMHWQQLMAALSKLEAML